MAKLEEITELLTDELEEFKKGITHLEKLSTELTRSKVVHDIYTIKQQIEWLNEKQDRHFQRQGSALREMDTNLAQGKLTPKWLLALFCIASAITVLTMGYFGYHFVQLEDEKIEAFDQGKKETLIQLRDFFDRHPDVYDDFQKWSKEKDSSAQKK